MLSNPICQVSECEYYTTDNSHLCKIWLMRCLSHGRALCAKARAVNAGVLRVIDEVEICL